MHESVYKTTMTHRQFSPIHLFTFPPWLLSENRKEKIEISPRWWIEKFAEKTSASSVEESLAQKCGNEFARPDLVRCYNDDRSRCAPIKPSSQPTLSRFITLLRLKIARNVAQKNNESPMRLCARQRHREHRTMTIKNTTLHTILVSGASVCSYAQLICSA